MTKGQWHCLAGKLKQQKVMAAIAGFKSPAGWLPRDRDQLRTQCLYRLSFTFYISRKRASCCLHLQCFSQVFVLDILLHSQLEIGFLEYWYNWLFICLLNCTALPVNCHVLLGSRGDAFSECGLKYGIVFNVVCRSAVFLMRLKSTASFVDGAKNNNITVLLLPLGIIDDK